MWTTRRVAWRTSAAALGFTALASFVLPGPSSALASAAAAPPNLSTVSAEHPVADPGPQKPDPAAARSTSVGFGGGVYLTASMDEREDVGSIVQVTRVSPAGDVLDPVGIVVSTDPGNVVPPVVAFDGTNFLVVWIEGSGVAARRVTPAGAVLDASDIVISTRAVLAQRPAISFDGQDYLVAWVSPQAAGSQLGDIFGRRVSPQGTVVDAADLTLSAKPAAQWQISLAFNGTDHLLAWHDDGRVYGTLVDRAGVPRNPAGTPFSSSEHSQSSPVVAAVGTQFFAAWDVDTGNNHIVGTRVSADGVPLDPAGIAISNTAQFRQTGPSLATNGTSVLVTWVNDWAQVPRTRFARVDGASGAVLDPADRPLPALWSGVQVASDGTDYLLAGQGVAVRLAASGEVLDPQRIVLDGVPTAHADPDTAFDGTNTFTVWTDDRYGDQRIFGARVGPDGQSLDGSGFSVSAPADLLDSPNLRHDEPAVAFDGANYLVVWAAWTPQEGGYTGTPGVQGARVSPSGQVLDRFTVMGGGAGGIEAPEVAFGDGVFLVVWKAYIAGTPRHDIVATRVSPAGVVLDPAPTAPLNWYGGIASSPAVAHGADGFTVVWNEYRSLGRDDTDVYGTRVSAAGDVQSPGIEISAGPQNEANPDIAWLDGNHLVVWSDGRGGIYGARLDGTGTVVDPDGFPIDPTGGGSPSVAANGVFFVAWSRYRSGQYDLVGARVTGAGAVGSPQFIANSSESEDDAVVTPASGTGRFSTTYERFDAPHGADRSFLRYVSPK